MKKILFLSLLVISITAKSQITLHIKNNDSTSKIDLSFTDKEFNKDISLKPLTSETFNLNSLHKNPIYTIRSKYGNFGSGRTEPDPILESGEYIMIFMWSQKAGNWKTVIRQYESDIDK